MPRFLCLLLLVAWLAPSPAWGEPLVMAYPNRPPYNYTENGTAAGSLVDLVRTILTAAGIEFAFTEMPSKRILAEIQPEDSRLCSFGWFKTPEREAYARFSRPFVQDTPLQALVLRRNLARFAGKTSLRELATAPALELGLVAGWSYGTVVEETRKQAGVQVVDIPARQQQALMLAWGRFAYTLVREAEVDEVVRLSGLSPEEFSILPLSDLQARDKRFFLYGRGVPADVLDRINAAIAKLTNVRE